VWGFGGGKPETVAEADASSGSFTPLRFVQDDGVGFGGGKPETAAEADVSSGSFAALRMTDLFLWGWVCGGASGGNAGLSTRCAHSG
jgi:hypothetical protein